MLIEPTREGDFILNEGRPFRLVSGVELPQARLHYAIYGELNERRDNAILVCHALSGSARVFDWWPQLFVFEGNDAGVFDLSRHCIICVNILGSCYGSTGPRDQNPATGKVYGADFPLVTVRDWVRAQAEFIASLGIEKLSGVIGGSIGGMQAIQWAIDYPERVEHAVAIGAAPLSALGLALNHLQRQVILNDPNWNNGEYTADSAPRAGLAIARAIAMCSYKSAELFTVRYSRRPNRNGEDPHRSLAERFDVGGYLDYQGEIFTRRFDAASYLIITKAMDNFDPAHGYASEAAALSRITARVLLVGISSDWLFPASDVKALSRRMAAAGVEVEYAELDSSHGHDGFLADAGDLAPIIRRAFEVETDRTDRTLRSSGEIRQPLSFHSEHPANPV
ncbi:MAG TPA: homoserine O-acetyltransferase [Blastocatellia bacterium]|nr:homoserine O-acetyltransferase [Blastocatellia bacterium]